MLTSLLLQVVLLVVPQSTRIFDIQGAGHVSPFVGQQVTTRGVVTFVDFSGFYLQDPIGDGDDDTSDGMFVFTGSAPSVVAGDFVEVTDTVVEYVPGGFGSDNLSITEFASPAITILGTWPLPLPVVIGASGRLPPAVHVISEDETNPPIDLRDPATAAVTPFDPDEDGMDFYESLEGMLVRVEAPLAVSAIRNVSSFSNEFYVVANGGAHVVPTDALTSRGGIELQPHPHNRGDHNPERIQIEVDPSITPVTSVTTGDALGDIDGVVGYSAGNYEVQAILPYTVNPGGLAEETTTLVGGPQHMTLASYNVLNLGPLASDDAQRAILGHQIAVHLGGPDVVALQEIQDNNGDISDGNPGPDGVVEADLTLMALAQAILLAGGPDYAWVDVPPVEGSSGGIPGGNIRNAFLYNPSRVTLLNFQALDVAALSEAGVSNPNAFAGSRSPLLAEFQFAGKSVRVINSHLSSRAGSSPIFGAIQPFVQSGEASREAQALALHEYVLQTYVLKRPLRSFRPLQGPKRIPWPTRVIVLGDFNTFPWTNDLTELLPQGSGLKVLENLVPGLPGDEAYSFVFEGNSQALDSAFVSLDLLDSSELDIVHLNVDFPRLGNPVASDHDPLVLRIAP